MVFCSINNEGTINACYSTGTILGKGIIIGGFCSDNTNGEINFSYWDVQSSGINISSGAIGKNTNEMKSQSNYTNWNYDVIWKN